MLRHARLREYARAHPWLAVAGASALTMGLVELVSALSGTLAYQHLLWNLFLAWVPLPIAGAAYVAHRRGRGLATIAPFLIGWLLFFPNAPYMVTELIHFGELGSRIPAGLDLATLITAAIAGLLVGFASLYVVQRVIGHLFGPAAAGAAVLLALTLGSVGVYLGRVLRWNSWDAISSPQGILADMFTRITHPVAFYEAWLGMALFAAFLVIAYVVVLRLAGRYEPITAD